ncbi:PREDICTED: glycine cleavage system H protein-like [Priapulus caudatus]|uniref:Glycine cleavage system H protein n=1 Tax=Priapulus caudatus TaxID=37621 RepID=A0ABM1E263_PRICU|nr:PREDICTED: glycine cleavage system H protein-like [Priapulus caudatus]
MFARNVSRLVVSGSTALMRHRARVVPPPLSLARCFSSKGDTKVIDGLSYTEKHEWVSMDGDVGKIGVTDYAQDALGDIVYAQMPDVDADFEKDEDFGALESVKAASELYCPVSGSITETNPAVEDKPALINTDCYGEGWLIKMKLSKPEELNDLMDAEQYRKFVTAQQDEADV